MDRVEIIFNSTSPRTLLIHLREEREGEGREGGESDRGRDSKWVIERVREG